MHNLQIGSTEKHGHFVLPSSAITGTLAILARKGSGKSYTASVLAEEMLERRQQIVAIDPTGAWFGLQSSADGNREGYPIVVFGGDHQNIPLEESAGEIIANAIVEKGFSAVLDLSLMRKGQMNRFMADFLETLYRKNRQPIHLFVDEADAFAPQKAFDSTARVLGAMEDIVRRGRKRGIGCTLITQRPAVINKNVLTQCDTLVTLRLSHPKDIAAIKEWVDVHAEPSEAKTMIDSLPSLPIGTAWFWIPTENVFDRVRVNKRRTFDSGATPKAGERVVEPKKLAPIDIEKLGTSIRDTVERAKAEDPRELRKEIADLKKQLSSKSVAVDQENLDRVVGKAIADRDNHWRNETAKLESENAALKSAMQSASKLFAQHLDKSPVQIERPKTPVYTPTVARPAVQQQVSYATPSNNSKLPTGEHKILTACAQYPQGLQRENLTVLTGYKRSSRDAYIQRLREKKYVEQQGALIVATQAGVNALEGFQPLPTGNRLQSFWLSRLPQGERAILDLLLQAYPKPVSRDELSNSTGYQRSSRDAYLQRMSAKFLVEIPGPGVVRASSNLFD